MAFDMYAGSSHEKIDHHEEFLFEIALNDRKKYPELCALHDALYSDPALSDEHAGRLVHELIELLAAGRQNKLLVLTVVRLLSFFSRAHGQKHAIRCSSD